MSSIRESKKEKWDAAGMTTFNKSLDRLMSASFTEV